MEDPIEVINGVIESINKVISAVENVVVYQEEVVLIRKLISSYARTLRKSNYAKAATLTIEQHSKFNQINSKLSDLCDTLQMISEGFWIQIALDWSTQKPMNDLISIMTAISSLFNQLDIKVKPYIPSDDKIAKDFIVIYNVFAKGAKDNPKVQERLNSVTEFMNLRNIPIPDSQASILPADIFDGIQEYIVKHEDYKIEKQIGFGASGQVFLATSLKDGQKVAIKQLNSTNLNDVEIESFTREIVILSTLHHPYLVRFIGATNVAPHWILTEFMTGKSLYHRLRDRKGLTPMQNTVIAYEVAQGMAFLHSKRIIHRDLKTLNVLLDSNCEPKICDFGISRKITESDIPMTGLIGTFNYMAPEVIRKSQYNLKADVFSYGLMLWEMLKRETPYDNKEKDQMGIAIAIVNGVRPVIPKGTPKPLERLIKDCWTQEADKRPSFNQILRRMERENICFKGANEKSVKTFYQNKISQNSKNRNNETTTNIQETEFEKLIRLIKQPPSEETNKYIGNILNSKESLYTIKENGFIEFAVPELNTTQNIELLTELLLKIIDSSASVVSFLHSNGANSVINMLQSKDKTKIECATKLIKHCSDSIDEENAILILQQLLQLQKYCLAAKLLKRIHGNVSNILKPFLSEILSESDKKQESRAFLLSRYFANEGLNEELSSKITTKFAIAMGSIELIDKLLKIETFTKRFSNNDIIEILKTLSAPTKNPKCKECALLIANALPNKIIEELSKYPEFVNNIVTVQNTELVAMFLYKICMSPEGSQNVLNNEKYLTENIRNPLILSLFILIGSFYSDKVIELKWLMNRICTCLKKRKYIETSLRVIGVISLNPKFIKQNEIKQEIINILKDSDYTELEITLLLGILYNLTTIRNIKLKDDVIFNAYPYILYLAEANCTYSGLAFRVISRFPLIEITSHCSKRIFDLIPKFIEKSDMHGKLAVGDFLLKFANDQNYLEIIKSDKLEKLINMELVKNSNPRIFIAFCSALKELGYKMTQDAFNALNTLAMQPTIQPDELSKLNALAKFYATEMSSVSW
ncbi:TKL family protein kinase [Histomonas meleagridis]|uniref:TKL family protein kinase n=1 Tax=Histomonas meleagridis TaxID=135588 RepID=UPI00355A30CC|nr:TKL family protein kinase [Histomonas meleagridis]KAH0806024.1 TKL family protein kinase [Histomonas meleagridis]